MPIVLFDSGQNGSEVMAATRLLQIGFATVVLAATALRSTPLMSQVVLQTPLASQVIPNPSDSFQADTAQSTNQEFQPAAKSESASATEPQKLSMKIRGGGLIDITAQRQFDLTLRDGRGHVQKLFTVATDGKGDLYAYTPDFKPFYRVVEDPDGSVVITLFKGNPAGYAVKLKPSGEIEIAAPQTDDNKLPQLEPAKTFSESLPK